MKKVIYIVTEGSYSDYHICGVYDDEHLAKKHVEMYLDDYYAQVEEYTLNELASAIQQGICPYQVAMLKNGSIMDVRKIDPHRRTGDLLYSGYDSLTDCMHWILRVRCWARDDEHAIKIANERRTQLIALDRWPKEQASRGAKAIKVT